MKRGDRFIYEFCITEQIYLDFINLFNDKNPLHTSTEFAKQYKFNDVVMHGNILCGFISYFVGECLPEKNLIILSEEIKFNNPVYMNNKLKFVAEVIDVFESVRVIEIGYVFENEQLLHVAKGKIQISSI